MNRPLAQKTDPDSISGAELTIRIFRRLEELETIAEQWDRLVFDRGTSPLLSHAWVATHFEFGRSRTRDWICFAAFDSDRLIGVLPVVAERFRVAGRTRTRLVSPLDPHTPVAGLVAEAGREAVVTEAILRAIPDEIPDWFGFELSEVPSTSALGRLHRSRIAGCTVLKNQASLSSYVPTTGSFDHLQTMLSRHRRRRLKKDRKKLMDLPDVSYQEFVGEEARPDLLDRFAPVEAAGWKGREGSAIASSEELMRFYRALLERLYRRGALEWQFLNADGRTIAGHMLIRSGRSVTVWKIGYDEAYSRCAPGVLLLDWAVKKAYEHADIDGLDLVTDKDWHDHWHPEKRPYYDIWIYPKKALPQLFGVLPKRLRWLLRAIPGLRPLMGRLKSLAGRE